MVQEDCRCLHSGGHFDDVATHPMPVAPVVEGRQGVSADDGPDILSEALGAHWRDAHL